MSQTSISYAKKQQDKARNNMNKLMKALKKSHKKTKELNKAHTKLLNNAKYSLTAAKSAEMVCMRVYKNNMRNVSNTRNANMKFKTCLNNAKRLSKVAKQDVSKFATIVNQLRNHMIIVNISMMKTNVQRELVQRLSQNVRRLTKKIV